MARTLKDSVLDKREARSRLAPRGKPYYRLIEEGLHLGYRKSQGRKGSPGGAGKWVLRHYVGGQRYQVETIGIADDRSDANGTSILNFAQAQTQALKRMTDRAQVNAGVIGPLTVADAM